MSMVLVAVCPNISLLWVSNLLFFNKVNKEINNLVDAEYAYTYLLWKGLTTD